MSYVLQSEIAADLPPQFLLQALDDDGDGLADAGLFAQVEASAAGEVDGILSARYTVPFAAPPAAVKTAARVFLLEKLYQRRGFFGEANPWTERADETRAWLRKVADGKADLEVAAQPARASVVAIAEPSRVYYPGGAAR